MNKNKVALLPLLFLGFSGTIFGQIKEEKLILDKKREPEVRKIEKKKTSVETIKNYPPQSKKIEDSLNLKYNVTDIPAVSDFKTSAIQSTDISPKFSHNFQNNYMRVGGGNYGKVLADANYSTAISDKNDVGIDLHYLTTSGLKKDYAWDSDRKNIDAAVFLNGFDEKGKYNATVNFQNDSYNYYGIYAMQPAENVDLKQRVNKLGLDGFYEFYESPILEKIAVKAGFLGDHFDTRENTVNAQILLKKELKLAKLEDAKIGFESDFEFEGLNTKFGILDKNHAAHSIIEFDPKIKFQKGQNFLAIGANMNFISQNNEILAEHENTSDFSVIPQVVAQYEFRPEFLVFASLDGSVHLNSFGDLLHKNPYLASNQVLKPTVEKYKITAGIKGDIGNNLKYNLQGIYSEMDDVVFFRQNGLFENYSSNRAAYDYLNSFSADYASGKLAKFVGSMDYFPMQNLEIAGELSYSKYTLDGNQKMLNFPELQTRITAKYKMLNDKLRLGFTGIFASGTRANIFEIPSGAAPVIAEKFTTVDGYADLNLSAEYQVHKNFSIFALGNNLLNMKYQNFYGYKNLGTQITGGIKFSF